LTQNTVSATDKAQWNNRRRNMNWDRS
jgi:hypothetical protein